MKTRCFIFNNKEKVRVYLNGDESYFTVNGVHGGIYMPEYVFQVWINSNLEGGSLVETSFLDPVKVINKHSLID